MRGISSTSLKLRIMNDLIIPGGVDYTEAFYNIYSIPRLRNYLAENGYTIFQTQACEIDVDLPKPKTKDWTTYAVKTERDYKCQQRC